jgi:hypothetical protein
MVYNTQNYWVSGLCPSSGILEAKSPLSAMKSPTHRDLYDLIDSSWVSISFESRVFRFYSRDSASGRHYMSSQIFCFFFLCVGALVLGFVG